MSTIETVAVNPSGDVPIPASVRAQTGIEAGSIVTIEARDGGIVIRPAEQNVELYTPERKAEFLLSNAVDSDDYVLARDEVRKLGLNPDEIPHDRPDRA